MAGNSGSAAEEEDAAGVRGRMARVARTTSPEARREACWAWEGQAEEEKPRRARAEAWEEGPRGEQPGAEQPGEQAQGGEPGGGKEELRGRRPRRQEPREPQGRALAMVAGMAGEEEGRRG